VQRRTTGRNSSSGILAAQRAYVRERTARGVTGIVVPDAFLRSIQHLGYRSTGDALAELIDNAIEAEADRVEVAFGYDDSQSKKPKQLAVLDNGHGMEPEMLRMAVMWGGSHREGDRTGLGRFGFGLPSSAVSLGRRFSVYSKVADGDVYRVTVDLDEIIGKVSKSQRSDAVLSDAVAARLPDWLMEQVESSFPTGWYSGTIVVVENLDRLEWTTRQGLRSNLCRQFAVKYHKLKGQVAISVDNKPVEAIDPLFLTPGFHLFDLDCDRSQQFDPVHFSIHDPESGADLGRAAVRYAWLPPSFCSIDKDREAVGLNANERFHYVKSYCGVLFSRNRRLVDIKARALWTSFSNNDRYIKVEVEFPASADELFGVGTTKQHLVVTSAIWNRFREIGMPRAIEQLRMKVREAKLARFALKSRQGRSPTTASATVARDPDRSPAAVGSHVEASTWPYSVRSRDALDEPFFSVGSERGEQVLYLSRRHIFSNAILNCTKKDLAANLVIQMLMTLGEATNELPPGHQRLARTLFRLWSKGLGEALRATSTAWVLQNEEAVSGQDGCPPAKVRTEPGPARPYPPEVLVSRSV